MKEMNNGHAHIIPRKDCTNSCTAALLMIDTSIAHHITKTNACKSHDFKLYLQAL